jgi:hypothetical protein
VFAYAVAIAVAFVVVFATDGSYTRLADLRFRRVWLFVTGIALQIGLDVVSLPRERFDDVGIAVLLVSYVALLGFCASNLSIRGIPVIAIGIALNAVVIALNLGMPFRVDRVAGIEAETTVKHQPNGPDDVLRILSDQIVLDRPVSAAISVGDIVLAVGIVDLAYAGSRRRRAGRVVDLSAAEAAEPTRVVDLVEPQPTRVVETARSSASNTRRS